MMTLDLNKSNSTEVVSGKVSITVKLSMGGEGLVNAFQSASLSNANNQLSNLASNIQHASLSSNNQSSTLNSNLLIAKTTTEGTSGQMSSSQFTASRPSSSSSPASINNEDAFGPLPAGYSSVNVGGRGKSIIWDALIILITIQGLRHGIVRGKYKDLLLFLLESNFIIIH